jgi:hypothetical protein
MNMAIIHALGKLYRVTHEERYLRMMRAIEKDWTGAGNYLQTGLEGLEFFQTPKPRWESMHDLEGLVELYRITGEEKYKTAFLHHWRSILRWDRRNTGGFSSGEQATGDPYAPTAIETCCTVAWMAVTLDALELTADSRAADELELSFYNAALGALHPSGRWCTYNTPMDGVREASAHTIVFQARAGTPELNCCAVNGPRGLGMLSEWAVLSAEDTLVVNYYGPGTYQGNLADNTPVALSWTTDYPVSDKVLLRVEPLAARRFKLLLRIPSWSTNTAVLLNGKAVPKVIAGQYLELNRRWEPGDRVSLEFDFGLRAVPGGEEAAGRISLYRGPILLAYDQGLNDFDQAAIPAVDVNALVLAKTLVSIRSSEKAGLGPWLVLELPAERGKTVHVCDFASAGASGTCYLSWFKPEQLLPPPVVTRLPRDGALIPRADASFRWSGPEHTNDLVGTYEVSIAPSPEFTTPVFRFPGLKQNSLLISQAELRTLAPGQVYYWKVEASNVNGTTPSAGPPAWFQIETHRSQ